MIRLSALFLFIQSEKSQQSNLARKINKRHSNWNGKKLSISLLDNMLYVQNPKYTTQKQIVTDKQIVTNKFSNVVGYKMKTKTHHFYTPNNLKKMKTISLQQHQKNKILRNKLLSRKCKTSTLNTKYIAERNQREHK